jgi:hypothetical protein
MQRTIGNAATIRRLTRPQTGDEAAEEIRARAEAFSGYDLSAVEIQPESQVADALNVEAVTVDKTIHVGSNTDQSQSNHGARILAHEFAHVIQQGLGETTDFGGSAYTLH